MVNIQFFLNEFIDFLCDNFQELKATGKSRKLWEIFKFIQKFMDGKEFLIAENIITLINKYSDQFTPLIFNPVYTHH
jgi:hypothetical protein